MFVFYFFIIVINVIIFFLAYYNILSCLCYAETILFQLGLKILARAAGILWEIQPRLKVKYIFSPRPIPVDRQIL